MHHTVFLCGDVMPGRGVDQILPNPGDPALVERGVRDARTYVTLAERVSGPIPRPAGFSWPWGAANAVLEELAPDARLLNLETSVTADGDFAPGKGVHYRMNPANLGFLTAIHPDVCVLANNHVLDFGLRGLEDTLDALASSGLRTAGAGRDGSDAARAVTVKIHSGRNVVVTAGALESSGVPRRWAATARRPGVRFVPDLSSSRATEIAEGVVAAKRPGDLAVVSLHWGSNWGYDVEAGQIRFAHRLADAGVDIVYGHSSHHPRPIEVYQGKLILYGCGDLVNDYEGIRGYEAFRDDLRLLYFAGFDPAGALISLRMAPMRARKMSLEHAGEADAEWLRTVLEHACGPFGTRIGRDPDGMLTVHSG
ncbi:MAG TPA: CapA family protein [Amycolatopsis sp.]|uniref:CapA family protein n=1 Tax=Amycolatopsis sp. TaxID=37632 RepID=UPI002B472615|nr:CapA family protein [Amycolatopsis sp.]HKS48216.1 CapA family protein [Amycolatopsis sp.]